MKKTSLITGMLGTALLLIPLSLFAQDDRAPLTDVWYVVPKQGMSAKFEAAAKAHVAFRRDAGDSRSWESYSSSVGSNPMLYQWRAGGLNWADMDAYVAEDQKNGYSEHWFANVDQYVEHYHHYIEESDYETSNWPEDLGQHAYYGVTTWTYKQGGYMASEEARKKLSKIAMDGGWDGHWLWHSRTGGQPALMVVSEYESFADMAPPEQPFFDFVAEQLGSAEEAGKLFQTFASGFTQSNYTIWAHRPDLSSQEMMAGADD